jgi:hypothetical protein
MTLGETSRRKLIRFGCGLPLAALARQAGWGFATEFWNGRDPSEWTAAQVKELLSKSPWAKEAEIKDNGQVGSLGSPRSGRGGSRSSANRTAAAPSIPKIEWKAIVRWDSALPVRIALKDLAPKDAGDFYVLNVVGNLPSALPPADEPEDRGGLAYLKEVTTLHHKGDAIHLARVELAPASDISPAGSRFYFSRMLALMPEDKEATFLTRIGPLELKCRFALKDMLYRRNLEL